MTRKRTRDWTGIFFQSAAVLYLALVGLRCLGVIGWRWWVLLSPCWVTILAAVLLVAASWVGSLFFTALRWVQEFGDTRRRRQAHREFVRVMEEGFISRYDLKHGRVRPETEQAELLKQVKDALPQ